MLKLKQLALRKAATIRLREDAGVFGGGRDDADALAQYFVRLRTAEDKYLVVYVMLKLALLEGRGILFVNDVDSCYKLKLFLELFSIRTLVLNAELPLASRLHAIESYNRGYYDLLIATDASVDAKNDQKNDFQGDEDEDDSDDEDSSEDEFAGGDSDSDFDEPKKKKKRSKTNSQKNEPTTSAREQSVYGVARGIDFQGVNWVLNVDFPLSATSYTHRVGRTARAGASRPPRLTTRTY